IRNLTRTILRSPAHCAIVLARRYSRPDRSALRYAIFMIESEASKSSTRQIVISEPDEGELQKQLVGRDLSPKLERFLTGLIKGKKWPRKINIPSAHDNLAAV